MPWTADDAERHTHRATMWRLKELWAKVAKRKLGTNWRRRPRYQGSERGGRAAGRRTFLAGFGSKGSSSRRRLNYTYDGRFGTQPMPGNASISMVLYKLRCWSCRDGCAECSQSAVGQRNDDQARDGPNSGSTPVAMAARPRQGEDVCVAWAEANPAVQTWSHSASF